MCAFSPSFALQDSLLTNFCYVVCPRDPALWTTHWALCQVAFSWTQLILNKIKGGRRSWSISPLPLLCSPPWKAMSPHHYSSCWRPPFMVPPLLGLPHNTIPSPVLRNANGLQLFLVSGCLNIPTWFLSPVSTSACVPYIKICLSAFPGVHAFSWQYLTAGEA